MNKLPWMLLTLLLACADRVERRPPTEIVARVNMAATSFEQVSVAVFASKHGSWSQVSTTGDLARESVKKWPFDVLITPEKGTARNHMIEVVVQLKAGGVTLATQRHLASFVAYEQKLLEFDLWVGPCNAMNAVCAADDCHGIDCLTCVDGSCASPLVPDLPNLTEAEPSPAEDAAQPDADADAGLLDASDLDSGRDAGPDASPDVLVLPVINCLTPNSGIRCDDGNSCNGLETCDPAHSPNENGCIVGASVVCNMGETCDETMDRCVLCGGVAIDADGDKHVAKTCGGDDCRDDDANVHPGAAEICNGFDDDCDGTSDGQAALTACPAPSGGHATCDSSKCGTVCDVPDSVLLSGVCTPKITCAAGYVPAADLKSCVDVDECATANGGCTATCVNEEASYHCACLANDTLQADGKTCGTQEWGVVDVLASATGYNISVAMNAMGTAYAVWTEDVSTGSQPPHTVRARLASSYVWGAAMTVRPNEGGAAAGRAYLDASGGAYAAGSWAGQGGGQIWGTRHPQYELHTLVSSIISDATLNIAGSNGNPYVVIDDSAHGGLLSFVGQSDGSWTTGPVLAENSGATRSTVSLTVSDDKALALWGENVGGGGSYWFARLVAGVWSAATKLGTSASLVQQTAAVTDSSGISHLFWTGDGVVNHTRVSKDGTVLGMDALTLAGQVRLHAVAGNSSVALGWSVAGAPPAIGVSTWSAKSGWKTTDFSNRDSRAPTGAIKLAMSSNDVSLLAVWQTQSSATDVQLIASRSNDLGKTWTPGSGIGTATEFDLAGSGTGKAVLVYTDKNSSTPVLLGEFFR